MKFAKIALSLLFVGMTANATLNNSKLDLRHQALIEKAAAAQCGMNRGHVTEVSTVATPIKVDQGITDYTYVTELEVAIRVDQVFYDYYKVEVKSNYFDHYDHEAKDWGVYTIESVSTCVQK